MIRPTLLTAAVWLALAGHANAETPADTSAASTVPWVLGHAVTFMALGVMVNMVNKPGAPVSVLVIAVGALVGGLLGLVGSRR